MPEFSLARTFRNRGLLLQTGSQFSNSAFMNVSVDGWMEFNFDNESSVVVGVMLIVGSFVCGYGAELLDSKKVSQE